MSLVLKSNKVYTGPELAGGYDAYIDRVISDGGEVISTGSVVDALLFAKQQGLDAAKTFSATSASWGIKRAGGNVTKLYSIFGSAGDLEVTGGSYPFQTIGGIPSFYSSRDAANTMRSVGTTSALNLAVLTSAKVLLEGDEAHALASMWDPANLDSNAGRVVQLTSRRLSGVESLAAFGGSGNSGAVAFERVYRDWAGEGTSISTDNSMRLYLNGSVVDTDTSATPHPVATRLYLGRSGSINSAMLKGNIAECWVLVDSTREQNAAVSAQIDRS